MRTGGGRARGALRERLQGRREEIAAETLARIAAISDPAEVADPAYTEGLRRALAAALAYGLETIDSSEGHDPPIPVELLAQARLAARNQIPLDTVLRRYFAGYSLLGFYLIEEAGKDGLLSGAELQRLTATQAGRFDRLLAAIADEHARESEALARSSPNRRQAEQIERLLAGERVDTSGIAYEFEGWHVGVAAGTGAERALRELAGVGEHRLLLVRSEEGAIWAWLGSRRRPDPAGLLRALAPHGEAGEDASPAIALGEPAEGLAGWRLSHRQALAALPVARRGPDPAVRYADVALLSAALGDDLLATSLRQLYLEPLEGERDGGLTLRRTLLTYLDCERNSASAAAALGVTRQTINSRLRAIEERIRRPLGSCGSELEVAIRLHPGRSAFPGKAEAAESSHIA